MSDAGTTQVKIEDAKRNHWPVVLYGLGQLGQDMGIQFLDWIGLRPKFVFDKYGQAIADYVIKHPGIKGIDYDNLLTLQKHVLVCVCLGAAYMEEVCHTLADNSFLHLITIDEITSLDSVIEQFYGIQNIRGYALDSLQNNSSSRLEKKERAAVYTCVTGDYDYIKEPLKTEENCDYFLISDKKYPDLHVYQQLDITDFAPGNLAENAEKNRWCKMHGHRIFENYRYSIYLDGTIQLLHPVSHYVEQIGTIGMALHKHPLRNCIYEEGLRLIANKRGTINYQSLREQMLRYLREGMPREYGLFECGMIVRDHANAVGSRIMEQWFEEYRTGIKRDQLSFTYILWKNGISSNDAGILNGGKDIRKNPHLMIEHTHGTKK